MTTFFCVPAIDFTGKVSQFTIATGPVIVNTSHDKILLHKGVSTLKWQFIGGRYDDNMTFRENAITKAHEVLGNNTVTLHDTEHPIIILDTIDLRGYEEKTLLVHYKATIENEEDTGECQWFSLDEIRMLDAKNETSSENVKMVSEQILK